MKKIVAFVVAMAFVLNFAGYPFLSGLAADAASGTPTPIDSFDDYGRLDTENKKEGVGAAKELASGSGEAGVYIGVSRAYSPVKDLSAYADSADVYVHLWLYIERSDYFMAAKDAYLELSSSGAGWTAGAIRYDISKMNVVDGWNELYLPLSDFERVDPNVPCDLENVNFFRLYFHNAAQGGAAFDQVILVDDLSIGYASDFETLPKHQETLIESFDVAGRGYEVRTDDVKQGGAAAVVSASGASALTLIERGYARAKDLSAYQNNANAYIHFWLYIDDVEYVNNQTDGRLELSSGGGWGSQVAKYDVKNMKLKSGWNELYLPISGFETLDPNIGECDWSRINYFRFYMQNAAITGAAITQTMKIDGLEAGIYAESDLPQESTLQTIESYDRTDNLLGAVAIDTENKTEGAGSATLTNSEIGADKLTAIESRYNYARDLSFYKGRDDAYVHVSLYLENADFFNNQNAARLELSSGTGWGAQVDYYDLTQVELKDGWNELYLPVKDFVVGEYGACDWSNINYTRIYLFNNISNSEQVFKLDNLSIGLESDFDIPEEGTRKTLESYDNPTKFAIDTDNKKEGAGSAKAEVTIDGNANYPTIFEAYYSQTKDLSFYQGRDDAYLHVWIYLSDAAWFRNDVDARLELSSGGNYGANVMYYDLTNERLEDGWNELFIPVSELQSMNNGELDWSKINYIRLFMHHIRFGGQTGTQTVRVDQLEIGLGSDFTAPGHEDTLVKVEGFDNADQFPVNTEEKKEGTGSAMVTAAGANPLTAIENIYSQKKDLSFYQGRDDAYLRFWLYVADASLINRNQDMFLEIGSGGGWTSGIARYSLADTDLQNGWNELYIPVSAFERHSDSSVTECDWSAVNYIRLYMFSAGAAGAEITQTMGIDGMYIGLESDFEVPPESTSRVIEDFDSPNKFTVDKENKKEGDGSAVVEVSGEGDVLTQIESAYAQPKNLTRYIQGQDAYLHLWVYLEDASLVNRELDGYLEIGSGGAWNSQISRYDITGLDFKDGWNELLIPVSEMQPHSDPAVGGCDWSHVNYMRFYLFNTTPSGGALNQTMRLDELSIGLGSDFSDAQPVQPVKVTSPILIEGYDNGKKFHVSTNNYKQGVGAAMSVAAGSGDVLTAIESTYTKPKDLSLYAGNPDAYIHVWIYVDDASLINRELDGYLEIGSGGTWNAGIARYDITQLALEDGWNELLIPVTAFERHGDASITPCDWSAVNYVRLYMFSAAPSGGAIEQTLGIDGLYIGWKSEFPDAESVGNLYTDGGYRLIEGYNDARKFQVNTQNKKEGYGSAMAAASGEGDVLTLIESTYTKPKDLSSYIGLKNAYVHIWLYVEDVSLINREADGYLEIGSGGVWNAGIARYDVTQLALQDGWNELLIPVSAFERHSDPSVTPCDWSQINYVRLYLYSAAPSGGRIEQTVGVDELTIGTAADFADVTPVGARYSGTEYRLVESYDDARKFQVSTSNKKEGYGAAMATASGNENVLTVIESTYTKPKDLSAFANNEEAYIQFWLYVEDAAAFNRTTDAYLEFSSGGAWNSQVSRFNLASLENLADGWNEILIPVRDMEDHTDPAVGGCDWSRINYIRVYLFSSIPGGGELEQTMGVDGLGIGLASDFELPEKDPVMLVESYDDPHRFTINTEDFKEGTGAAMVETDTAGSVLTAIETAYSYTKDMSEYAASSDGCVSFWLYLEDVSYFNRELDAFMEFSSGGSWAAAVARYDVTKLDLQNGWNHVVIPLSEFDRSPDPTFDDIDWSSVNYIRFYLFNTIPGGSAPQKLMIDGLQAGHMADFLTDDGISVEGLHSDAVMLSDGYGEAASAGAGIPTYIWWIVGGGAGAVVVAAAVVIPVVVIHKKKKKKQSENVL